MNENRCMAGVDVQRRGIISKRSIDTINSHLDDRKAVKSSSNMSSNPSNNRESNFFTDCCDALIADRILKTLDSMAFDTITHCVRSVKDSVLLCDVCTVDDNRVTDVVEQFRELFVVDNMRISKRDLTRVQAEKHVVKVVFAVLSLQGASSPQNLAKLLQQCSQLTSCAVGNTYATVLSFIYRHSQLFQFNKTSGTIDVSNSVVDSVFCSNSDAIFKSSLESSLERDNIFCFVTKVTDDFGCLKINRQQRIFGQPGFAVCHVSDCVFAEPSVSLSASLSRETLVVADLIDGGPNNESWVALNVRIADRQPAKDRDTKSYAFGNSSKTRQENSFQCNNNKNAFAGKLKIQPHDVDSASSTNELVRDIVGKVIYVRKDIGFASFSIGNRTESAYFHMKNCEFLAGRAYKDLDLRTHLTVGDAVMLNAKPGDGSHSAKFLAFNVRRLSDVEGQGQNLTENANAKGTGDVAEVLNRNAIKSKGRGRGFTSRSMQSKGNDDTDNNRVQWPVKVDESVEENWDGDQAFTLSDIDLDSELCDAQLDAEFDTIMSGRDWNLANNSSLSANGSGTQSKVPSFCAGVNDLGSVENEFISSLAVDNYASSAVAFTNSLSVDGLAKLASGRRSLTSRKTSPSSELQQQSRSTPEVDVTHSLLTSWSTSLLPPAEIAAVTPSSDDKEFVNSLGSFLSSQFPPRSHSASEEGQELINVPLVKSATTVMNNTSVSSEAAVSEEEAVEMLKAILETSEKELADEVFLSVAQTSGLRERIGRGKDDLINFVKRHKDHFMYANHTGVILPVNTGLYWQRDRVLEYCVAYAEAILARCGPLSASAILNIVSKATQLVKSVLGPSESDLQLFLIGHPGKFECTKHGLWQLRQ
jgi:hypothetical protein